MKKFTKINSKWSEVVTWSLFILYPSYVLTMLTMFIY